MPSWEVCRSLQSFPAFGIRSFAILPKTSPPPPLRKREGQVAAAEKKKNTMVEKNLNKSGTSEAANVVQHCGYPISMAGYPARSGGVTVENTSVLLYKSGVTYQKK